MISRAWLGIVLSCGLLGCTADRPSADPLPSDSAGGVGPVEPDVRGVPITRVPADVESLPWFDGDLPRSVPATPQGLPRLQDDPPRTALMVYRPVESLEPASGWESETLYFYGAEQGWVVANLGDLGLSDSTWPNFDQYGAGELSPDGKRWVGYSRTGVVVIELTSGDARAVGVPDGEVSWVRWFGDSERVLLSLQGEKRSTVLDVRTGKARPAPFSSGDVALARDGGAVELLRTRDKRVVLREWRDLRGPPVDRELSPAWLKGGRRDLLTYLGGGLQAVPLDVLGHRIGVLDRSSLGFQAVLESSRRGGEYLSESHGFLRSGTFLVSRRASVVAWDPATGRVSRVMPTPRALPPFSYTTWDASFALDAIQGGTP